MAKLPISRRAEAPAGFEYIPDFISSGEEIILLEHIIKLPFQNFIMGEYVANRMIVNYGYSYSYGQGVKKIEDIPDWLLPLRSRIANIAKLDAGKFVQALVAFYPEKATVGWHRDAPQFDSVVVGFSLASEAKMRFRLMGTDREELFVISLAPRSAYIIKDKARSAWQHSIAPVKKARYSVTFRMLRENIKYGPMIPSGT